MRSVIGDLVWRITGDTKDVDKNLKKTDKNVDKVGKSFSGAGKAAVAAMAVVAVAAVVKVSEQLIAAASDAEETQNKFAVTFSSISELAEQTADDLAESFGLSSTAAKGLLADTGDLLSGFGFTQSEALKLSSQVNELAVDLASFTNFSGGAAGASEALTKGLLGERESMKALGIAIMEADIQQLAEDKGIVGELDRQTKAQLTLELALRQSKNAIGDFERSSDSYANQTRVASAAVEDLKVALGESLLPAATESVKIFAGLTQRLTDFISERKKLRDAEEAIEGGQATAAQRLLELNERIRAKTEELEEAKKAVRDVNVLADEEYLKLVMEEVTGEMRDQLNLLVKEADTLQYQIRGEQLLLNAQQEQLANTEKIAAAEEDRIKNLNTYLDLVNGEYEKTTEGQIEKLEQEIALWEMYAETAVNTAPEIEAILERKQEQLDGLNKSLGTFTAKNKEGFSKDPVKEYAEELTEAEERMKALASVGIGTLLSGFSDLGEELVSGELSWNSFAKVALNAVAAVLDALGAQLAAIAAVNLASSFIPGLQGSALGVGPALIGSAAAYSAAGVVRGLAGTFESGGIIPGPPSISDNKLITARSGEEVIPEEDPRHSNNIGDSQLTINWIVDGDPIAKMVVEDYINSGRHTITQRGLR